MIVSLQRFLNLTTVTGNVPQAGLTYENSTYKKQSFF